MNYKNIFLWLLVILPPGIMILSRQFYEGNYLISSIYKLVFLVPLSYRIFIEKKSIKNALIQGFDWKLFKKNIFKLFGIALALGTIFLGAFLIFKNSLDLQGMVSSLDSFVGVNKSNIIFIGLYVIFFNSFLEEYFWRGFMFKELKSFNKVTAYILTSIGFALHHVMIIYNWFPIMYLVGMIAGLMAFAIIMNTFFEKYSLFSCWFIHALMDIIMISIGYMVLAL